jgi:hypothetical protein
VIHEYFCHGAKIEKVLAHESLRYCMIDIEKGPVWAEESKVPPSDEGEL